MLKSISKLNNLILSFVFVFCFIIQAKASDISAIDFNGDLIGKVMPDGNVINFNNELVGYITADGFIFDDKNEIIGGVVPQGVVISNKNTVLGKINNDGSVISMSNNLIGKALPNGLVVNDNFDIIGSIVSTGLVYTDTGSVLGRISGDGYFYDLKGRNTGFVTDSGYVYVYDDIEKRPILSGSLVSSKFVISPKGKFLGSVAPNGKVIDIKKETIGSVHANGYVYNKKSEIIGHVVERGYAFDYNGNYLGIISYNGEVVNNGKVVAISVNNSRIIDANGKLIGFSIPLSATSNTIDGKFLGRILPNGQIAKGRDIVGKIGVSGNVVDANGMVIGYINSTGPLFNYLGENIANASIDGSVVSLDGTKRGYIHKNSAFDKSGKFMGDILQTRLVYDNNNKFLGISGVTSLLNVDDETYTISPSGYVFSNDKVVGSNFILSGLYSPNGEFLSYMSLQGNSENASLNEIAKLNGLGVFWDKNRKILASNIDYSFVTDILGKDVGEINNNLVIKDNKVTSKIYPNGSIVNLDSNIINSNQRANNSISSISINGDYIGTNLSNGTIINDNVIIGRVASDNYSIDNTGGILGKAISSGVVVNSDCEYIGVVSDQGKARNFSGTYIGNIIANNQVLNDSQEVVGYVIIPRAVIGKDNQILGVQNSLGNVLNYQNEKIGCQDINGLIRNSQKEVIGKKVEYASVMSFNDNIIGYTDSIGNIIDNQNIQVAKINIDGNITSDDKNNNIGVLFKYSVAFDNNNIYLGRVDINGNVISDDGLILGKVLHNGKVITQNEKEGYALYDLYVYDNDGKTVGYISKNGDVYTIMGEQIGTIYNGFVLNKKRELIARGLRDYYIRNNENQVIGYLKFDGQVLNINNIEVGTLTQSGDVVNKNQEVIAKADPLQYYQIPAEPNIEDINQQDEDKPVNEQEDKNKESIVDGNMNSTTIDVGVNNEDKTSNDEAKLKDDKIINEDDSQENVIDENIKINENIKSSPISDKTDNEAVEIVNHKIIGIAISPGGNYIGDVTSDGDVLGVSGEKIAVVSENGEVIGNNGEIIGEFQKNNKNTSSGIDSNFKKITEGVVTSPYIPTSEATNVGPGGGIGPGGRYNPQRARILEEQFKARRSGLSGTVVSSGGDFKAYTGWQDDWGTVSKSKVISTLRVDMSNVITADKPIPAVMARSLISLGGAPATAIVERNIYADSGRNVIIPAGSRIIGGLQEFDTDERFDSVSGGVKIEIKWERIIRPDGIAFDISAAQTGDAQGRGGGALGYVDEQMVKKYALPIAGTVATSAIAYMMAANEDAAASSQIETSKQQAASDARTEFLQRMDEILNEIIESKKQIEPVTYVPAGTRIIIYPMADLWLRTTKDVKEGATSISPSIAKDVLIDENATDNSTVSSNNGGGNQQVVNNNQNNNSANNQPKLISEKPNKNNQQQAPVAGGGTLPPPAADGSEMMDIEEEEDLGEIELF